MVTRVAQKQFTAKMELPTPTDDGGDPAGTFVALVSVFGNEDQMGDIVEAGAFTKTLAEWVVKGAPIPVVWSHQFRDPENIIGHYSSAEETEQGLRVKGHLDLGNPRAAQIYGLMQKGLLTEFSWSGEVRKFETLDPDDKYGWGPIRILEVDLWEAGPCFKGANAETELVSVKTNGQISGQVFTDPGRGLTSKSIEALKSLRAAIGEVLAAEEAGQDQDGGPEPSPPQVVQRASAATMRALGAASIASANPFG